MTTNTSIGKRNRASSPNVLLTVIRTAAPLWVGLLVLLLLNLGLYRVLPPADRDYFLAPSRTYWLQFDQPYFSVGWYGVETSDTGITYKWTRRPDAWITLPLRAQDDLELIIQLHLLSEPMPDAFGVVVDDTEIPLVRDDHVYRGIIPLSARRSPDEITLRFIAPQTIYLPDVDPSSNDQRTLGVAVDWLIIRPVTMPGRLYEFDTLTPAATNWYGSETDTTTGFNFRWTSAESADLPVDNLPIGIPFRVEVALVSVFVFDGLEQFSLSLDGEPLELTRADRDGRFVFSADIPARTQSEGVFTFSVPSVSSPVLEGRGSDERMLGAQVDWMRIIVEGSR